MQRSYDDLGTPLHKVTFCVLDLETTGASPDTCEITEVGAARYRGGECLGTLQTLVDPEAPIAAEATALTGITDAMVRTAPPLGQVLPTLAEFVGGAVLVGHNLRFDVSFLDAALTAEERDPVGLRVVDTLALARPLLRGDVTDCRLSTLARHLGLDHRPTHRALDDALATADLLHILLERAAAFGVSVLDDLLRLPRLLAHPQAAKLGLTNRLPRRPGVAVLRDGQGRPLDVVAATDDLRRRVRSLFSGEHQRTAGAALRELHAVDHLTCPPGPAADVAEIRLTDVLEPRRSPRRSGWQAYRYVRLGTGARGRLTVGRTPGRGRALGPLRSAAAARIVVDAVELAGSQPVLLTPVDPADESATGPAASRPGAADLFDAPDRIIAELGRRAATAREAGHVAHAAALERMIDEVTTALTRQRRLDRLRGPQRVVLATDDGGGLELARGRLARAWEGPAGEQRPDRVARGASPLGGGRPQADGTVGPADPNGGASTPGGAATIGGGGDPPGTVDALPGPPPSIADGSTPSPAVADELLCIAAWIDRHAHRLRPVHVEGELASPLVPRPEAPGLRCRAC